MKNILIIEDDIGSSKYFEYALKRSGYNCTVVSDIIQAETIIKYKNYDLLLLDLFLPIKSGIRFIKELQEKYPTQKIIIVTAVDYKKIPFDFSKYTVLRKPIPLKELLENVNKNIN